MDPKKRVRPTSSNRKSRSKDAPSSSQHVMEDPQEEEVVVEHVVEDSYFLLDRLFGSPPQLVTSLGHLLGSPPWVASLVHHFRPPPQQNPRTIVRSRYPISLSQAKLIGLARVKRLFSVLI
ncbi:hypothetical protein QJS10_CPB11g01388 [Acorus calamus]|uniref:Uncharacterized protein n=1 Tax=Acorus calamus TaxID=4465 RepID=A0AAV9DRK2_ACOCL|nr:hypothetical protein QJS10_CPB11g01388 [Acorus calamus]